MRTFVAAVLASTLLASSALAATVSSAALDPGKPAGVKTAQAEGSTLMWGLGLAVVVGGAILVGTNGSNNNVVTTTTGTVP